MPRPPLPVEIAEITGAYDRHPERRRPRGPKSTLPIGEPPQELDDYAACVWREIVHNAPHGVLTGADRFIVEQASRLVARGRCGSLTAAETNALKGCLVELGMTPSARGRLVAPAEDEDDRLNVWDS